MIISASFYQAFAVP